MGGLVVKVPVVSASVLGGTRTSVHSNPSELCCPGEGKISLDSSTAPRQQKRRKTIALTVALSTERIYVVSFSCLCSSDGCVFLAMDAGEGASQPLSMALCFLSRRTLKSHGDPFCSLSNIGASKPVFTDSHVCEQRSPPSSIPT